MGLFTKEEKLYIDKKTGRSEWVTIKKGLPKLRKEKTGFDKAVADFKRAEKQKIRTARKAKIDKISTKINKARTNAGKHINPAILTPGGGLDLNLDLGIGSSKKQKVNVKKPKDKFIIRNGKAYKIARPVQQKKKPKKKKGDDWDDVLNVDPFDFGGF